MTQSEIMRMPLPPLHDDCVLFFWRVSSMVEEAYQVVRAWDFTPKTELVWEKTTDESGEKLSIGMGRILRGAHETCIVATRGDRVECMSKSERTVFRAPRGKHSEKPEEFYRIIERLYPLELWPEAHVELFARRRRKGWIQYGYGLPGTWEHAEAALAHETEEADGLPAWLRGVATQVESGEASPVLRANESIQRFLAAADLLSDDPPQRAWLLALAKRAQGRGRPTNGADTVDLLATNLRYAADTIASLQPRRWASQP